jgi:heat shock protein HslJ
MMKKLLTALSIMLIIFTFGACMKNSPNPEFQLENQKWILIDLDGNAPIYSTNPMVVVFEDGQVSGNAGCNQYFGNYQIKGDAITFANIAQTEMACLDPEEVMEQERVYLDLLETAQHFEEVDDMLIIFTGSENKLIFVMQQDAPEQQGSLPDQPGSTTVTTSAEVIEPLPRNTLPLPGGYKEYQDSVVGVSVYIPENWLVTGDIEGETATFLSYPEDKYGGKDVLEQGDTKCELIIHGPGHTTEMQLAQYRTPGITTIFSEEEIVLSSGKTATRLEVDIMGDLLTLVVAEVNTRVIVLQCFGDHSQFDDIALTIIGVN